MKYRSVFIALILVGLVTGLWALTSLASADAPHKKGKITFTQEQISIPYSVVVERNTLASSAAMTYTWAAVVSPVNYTLTSVDLAFANDGWAVGYFQRAPNGMPEGAVILQWDGTFWNEWWSSESGLPLMDMTMVSANDGWIVGSPYSSLTYRWDGDNWNSVPRPLTDGLNSVAMVSANDGWAVGGGGNCTSGGVRGIILRWNGDAWSESVNLPYRVLKAVSMVSANDGWAVGYYCYFSGTPPSSGNSVILHWNGSNWNYVDSPTYQTLNSVDMVSTTDGWAVSDGGAILRWDGSHWSNVSSPTSCALRSVSMVSSNDGWIVGGGGYGCPSQPSIILHWNGSVWSEVPSPVAKTLNSVTMLSSGEGWAVGEGGTILHYTSVDKLVRVVGAGTADYDWNSKDQFNPGDPIRWFIQIDNDTGADAQIELTYDAKGPNNETVLHEQFVDTIPPGRWYWGYDGTVPEGMGGTHILTGSGLYMGITSQAVITYTVTGPTMTATPTSTSTATPTRTPTITPTPTVTPTPYWIDRRLFLPVVLK